MVDSFPVLDSPSGAARVHASPSLGKCMAGAFAWCGLLALAAVVISAGRPAAGSLSQATFSNWGAEHYRHIQLHGYAELCHVQRSPTN